MPKYKILKKLTIKEGLELISDIWDIEKVDNFIIRTSSKKLKVYKVSGCKCNICGKEAKFFAIVDTLTDRGKPHLELFRLSNKKQLVPFTMDHIIPKSKGGSNKLSNLQTTCWQCNFLKDKMLPTKKK